MQKKELSRQALLLLAFSGLLTFSAEAQDTAKSRDLDEVVVTATRFPKKISETGKVVTVIGRSELEQSGAKDLSQVLNEQAGIVVNGATSNPGLNKSIYMRGATNDYTAILINGIPVSDPTGIGGAFDLRLLPVEIIERIEILKGAQSTLYGSDAVAGVINIITKKGYGKPVQLYGGVSGGSYNTWKANAGLSGSSGKASYNVSFIHNETRGISEAKDTNAIKTFDKDGYRENAFSADFDAQPLDGLHIKPFFRYSYYKGGYDAGSFTDSPDQFTAQLISTGALAQYLFRHGSVSALYGYDELTRTYSSYAPYNGNKKTVQVYAHYNLAAHAQLLAGLDYNRQLMNDTSASVKNPSAELVSPYLSLFLKDLSGFNLEIGGRYNKHSIYGSNSTYSINPSWLVQRKVKLFANIATAFRAPSLSSLYGQFGANPGLKPETSKTYEAGVQASLLSDKLELKAVWYSRKINNVIIYGPLFAYINLNTQNSHGVEIEPTIHLNKKLTLKLFYAYTEGTTTTSNAGKDSSYNNLIRVPKNSFGADIACQLTPRFFVSTHISSYGQRNDIFFDNSTYLQSPVVLKSYTLWDAYAEYSLAGKKLKIFLSLRNITGADYYEVYGYSVMGRNMNAGLRVAL